MGKPRYKKELLGYRGRHRKCASKTGRRHGVWKRHRRRIQSDPDMGDTPGMRIRNHIEAGRKIPPKGPNGTRVHIYQKVRRTGRRRILLPDMANENNIQNLPRTNSKKTRLNNAHYKQNIPIWIHRRNISTRRRNGNREIYTNNRRKRKTLLMDPPKAFRAINRTPIWTTPYKKGDPAETVAGLIRGRRIKNYRISKEKENRQ